MRAFSQEQRRDDHQVCVVASAREAQERNRLRLGSCLVLLISLIVCSTFSVGCEREATRTQEGSDFLVILPPPQVTRDQSVEVDMAPLEGPSLNAIYPSRAPREGGQRARVVGLNFRAPMRLNFGEYPCQALRVESETSLSCEIPPSDRTGAVTLRLSWLEEVPSEDEAGEAREVGLSAEVEEGFTYYQPLQLDRIEPAEGPAGGGIRVAIRGAGFQSESRVSFAGIPARSVELESPTLMFAELPPGPPGLATVTVSDAFSIARLEDAFLWRAPVVIDSVRPAYGPSRGGELLRIYGSGLLPESRVFFASTEAEIERVDPGLSRIELRTPPNEPGFVPLSLENRNGAWRDPRGYLYLPSVAGPFQVFGLVPDALPSDEGGRLIIGGNGFRDETEVTLDGRSIFCERESFASLACQIGPNPPGEGTIEVRQGDERAAFPLRFYQPLALYDLRPPRGATVGGGVVYLVGRGIDPETEVFFDESPAELIAIDEEGRGAWVRVPPHAPGEVSVLLRGRGLRTALNEAFLYFDPSARFGGIYGEPIEGAVNVTVLDSYERRPVLGARVWVDTPAGRRFEGITDEAGEVTIGDPNLSGPLQVSAGKQGFEAGTYDRVVSENVTFLLAPEMPPPQDGEPPPAPAPVTLRGRLEGLSGLPKPPEGEARLLAFIDTSHRGALSRSSNLPPAPLGILQEDGPFEITARAGQFALVATAAYVPTGAYDAYEAGQSSYWFMREQSAPIAIGLLRGISLSPGGALSELLIRLDIPCTQRVAVDLYRPSAESEEGPLMYELRAHLDLGAEGYWQLDGVSMGANPQLQLAALPGMALLPRDVDLLWLGVSRSESYNPLGYQFQREARRPLPPRVELRPVLGLPHLEIPAEGEALDADRLIRWSLWPAADGDPPEPAEATLLRLSGGGRPLWTVIVPGGQRALQLPRLPLEMGLAGLIEGELQLTIQPLRSGRELNYQDFDYIDLAQPEAYSLYRRAILVDQESLNGE
ncbi:MAG: IPT/TIG domain-containing protein [Myxococcota bacterium]|nr:IPT/TIG domain-containing protein [Myxococcota bacterium]